MVNAYCAGWPVFHVTIVRPWGKMIIMTSPVIATGQVTAADLFSEVTAARRDISNVLTKVEVMDARHGAINAVVADHETRLRAVEGKVPDGLIGRLVSVEKWQLRAGAIIGFIALVVGVVSGYLSAILTHVH